MLDPFPQPDRGPLLRPDPSRSRPLVIGVGNRDRGDDGVGPLVAERLAADHGHEIDAIIVEGDLSDLPLRWTSDRDVVVVDAMVAGLAPGSVLQFDGLGPDLGQPGTPLSSHGVGLAEAVALARHLGRLPASLVVIAIEGVSFGCFDQISGPVADAVDDAIARILAIHRPPV